MPLSAFGLTLLAAVLHAVWNAVVKSSNDRLVAVWAIATAGGLVNIVVLGIAGLPDRSVWGYIVASACVHTGYAIMLASAYEHCDFAVAYPLARGSAPLLVTFAGVTLLDDRITAVGLAGIALISAALMSLAFTNRTQGVQWALGTGVFIAGYTIIDGAGVRADDESLRYIGAVFVVHALLLTIVVLARRPRHLLAVTLGKDGLRLAGGGAVGALAYLLVMIAARDAPLGAVAGLRETSGVFGVLIGYLALRENVRRRHAVAVVLAAAGAAALALS